MASGKVSRRWVVGALGAGALAMPLLAGRTGEPNSAVLTPGERLARWIIADVEPLHQGAVGVVLHSVDDASHRFRLEIMARDSSPLAARPPVETRHFAVFVCNGGDGFSPTVEDQGLAAMTLAARIARSELPAHAEGFLTHAERIARYPETLVTSA